MAVADPVMAKATEDELATLRREWVPTLEGMAPASLEAMLRSVKAKRHSVFMNIVGFERRVADLEGSLGAARHCLALERKEMIVAVAKQWALEGALEKRAAVEASRPSVEQGSPDL